MEVPAGNSAMLELYIGELGQLVIEQRLSVAVSSAR
jgi:hypothetical protein